MRVWALFMLSCAIVRSDLQHFDDAYDAGTIGCAVNARRVWTASGGAPIAVVHNATTIALLLDDGTILTTAKATIAPTPVSAPVGCIAPHAIAIDPDSLLYAACTNGTFGPKGMIDVSPSQDIVIADSRIAYATETAGVKIADMNGTFQESFDITASRIDFSAGGVLGIDRTSLQVVHFTSATQACTPASGGDQVLLTPAFAVWSLHEPFEVQLTLSRSSLCSGGSTLPLDVPDAGPIRTYGLATDGVSLFLRDAVFLHQRLIGGGAPGNCPLQTVVSDDPYPTALEGKLKAAMFAGPGSLYFIGPTGLWMADIAQRP